METPKELKYSEEHIWVRELGGQVRLGVTDFLQDELGDVVFVELPRAGEEIKAGDAFGSVESVKSVTELYSPVTGTVTEINPALTELPGRINMEPYASWMVTIRLADPSETGKLWDADRYASAYGIGDGSGEAAGE